MNERPQPFGPEMALKNDNTNQARILVAGGAGFLGSYLCEALLQNKCQVFCLDNFVKAKKKNLEKFFEDPNFIFVEHDLKRSLPSDLPRTDYVFHLAGLNCYLSDEKMRLETLLVNSLGTQHLLEYAKKTNAKFLLASSLKVFEGVISKTTLKNYFGESKLSETKFSHREAKRFSENLCFEYFQKYHLDTRIVRVTDVYGPGMPLDTEEELSVIFQSLKKQEALKIKGSGQEVIYPTFIADLIPGLEKAMFTQSSKGKIFALVNLHKETLNEAIHKIEAISQKLNVGANIRIEFVPQEESRNFQAPEEEILKSQEDLGWQPKTDFATGINATLLSLNLPDRQPLTTKEKSLDLNQKEEKKVSPKAQLKKPKTGKTPPLFFTTLWLFFLLIILSPFLFFSLEAFLGFKRLKTSLVAMEKGETKSVRLSSQKAQENFKKANRLLLGFNFLLQPLAKEGVSRTHEILLLAEDLTSILKEMDEVSQKEKEFIDLVFQKKSGSPLDVYDDLKMNLETTLEKFSLIEAKLGNLKPLFNLSTFSLGKNLKKLNEDLPARKKQLEEFKNFTLLLPEFLGFKQKKTYLLVFQNNSELRPTGGFIGSYGLLTFEKGKLLDFEVQDVYTADGQLKGHVEPPEELRKYLNQAQWYLRDANWDPDWTKTAPRLAWFLEKELKRGVDGVIGLNLTTCQEILGVTGPLKLPDYQEEITKDNLFERAEYYSEINFFSGSTQKKDFLGELNRLLMLAVKDLENEKMAKLSRVFFNLLREKQLLLYFNQKDLANFTRQNFWDGSIREIDEQKQSEGLQDFLMLVEANLGVNKANFFVKRTVSHKLRLTKDLKVEAESLISYENNSPGESWPAGIYKNYLRVYLPKNATGIKIYIDKQDRGEFIPLASNKIKEQRIEDKKAIGFLLEVPVKEKLIVKINYGLGEMMLKDNQGILAFYFQKQSGIVDDPLNFSLDYPSYLWVLKVSPEASSTPQNLVFSTNQREDRLFVVNFYKK